MKEHPDDPPQLAILIQKLNSMMTMPLLRPFSAVVELLVHVIRDVYREIGDLKRARSKTDP